MSDDLQCLYWNCCPIRNFKPTKYFCNNGGLVKHISSLDGKEIITNCDDYISGESSFWRTDLMLREDIEERIKNRENTHG